MKKISLSTSFFDDNKIKAMSLMKNCDAVLLLYFKLLFGACRDNSDGKLILFGDVAYDEKVISGIYNIPEKTVAECLELLIKFGFLTKTNACYVISNYAEIVGRDNKESHNESQRKYVERKKPKQEDDRQIAMGVDTATEG